ncbi:MAG: beta strand repeat-containing protein [Xenococcus sp. (in: cyanobacteria)]
MKGDAGNILVDANSVSIIDGAGFIVSTIGEGNGGNITVNARDTITMGGLGDPIPKFNNVIRSSGLKTQVRGEEDVTPNSKEKAGPGIGNGGTIEINTNVLSASQVAIVADSTGGNSGNININANDSILVNGSLVNGSLLSTRINDNAVGNAGSIGLNTNILSLNNASILTDTLGQGNAGDFIIEATEVTIEKSNILSQSRLGARGNGGSVHINVLNDIFLRNSQIATQVLDNVVGNSGNIDINAKSLLTQGTQILVDNQGAGNSGNITINTTGSIVFDSLDRSPQGAPTKILTQLQSDVEKQGGRITITGAEISLNNFAQISANTAQGSVGEPGNITLNADGKVSITNGSLIDALTENDFDGGNINIIASFLELKNGGKLVTGAEGNSNAGDITLNISGDIILNNGSPPESTITFNEPILENLKFQTGIFANNSPNSTGDGGNIVITADSIKFEDRGFISVNTFTGEGGTINLTVNDTIFLQNNSLISAEAEGIGNGGNITINTNFIVAFPNQNSDILTRAAQKGEGGDIDITAEALFGIQERSSTPPNETNDIDASSEFGLDGSVSISTPDTNRIQTDIKLPDSTIEAERTVAQACQGDRYGGISSNLTVKGKGGVSPTPIDPLYSDEILVDNQELTIISNLETQYPNIKPIQTSLGDIYPARGIIKTEEGNIILTAYPNNNTNIRTPHNSNCN